MRRVLFKNVSKTASLTAKRALIRERRAWLSEPTPQKPKIRTRTFEVELPKGAPVDSVTLKGTWDGSGRHDETWKDSARTMVESPPGTGRYVATVKLLDDGSHRDWAWGAEVSLPGAGPKWVAGADKLTVNWGEDQTHRPLGFSQLGVRRRENDVTVKAWFPNAKAVSLKTLKGDGTVDGLYPLVPSKTHAGWWEDTLLGAFESLNGKPYVYQVHGQGGTVVDRVDNYALELQGEQRGVRRLFISRDNGSVVHAYEGAPSSRHELMWFHVNDEHSRGVNEVFLQFRDEAGAPVNAHSLRERLGSFEPDAVLKARSGEFNDFWDQPDKIGRDGRIQMSRIDGSYSVMVHNAKALEGLRYEFQKADGEPLGAHLGAAQANDRWSSLIDEGSGLNPRAGIIRDLPALAPHREPVPSSAIYQTHVASFMSSGQNANRSTFRDLIKHLDYIKSLGITDIQLLPVSEVAGISWGYEGVSTLAIKNSYGFVENGKWLSGPDAMKRFVDEAHQRGLNVVVDVVLNHLHEEFGQRWHHDGDAKENVWFNHECVGGPSLLPVRDWGLSPAFGRPEVAQFLTDHVLYLTTVMGADGVRFDFTEPMTYAPKGKELLRNINGLLEAFGTKTRIAEHFPYETYVTKEIGHGGLGFTDSLNVEVNHALVNDNHGVAVLPAAAKASATNPHVNLDTFARLISKHPEGFEHGWASAVNGVTTHDEVGNGTRAVKAAGGYSEERPSYRSRANVRLMHFVAALSPGKYMLFEGEESGARNDFKWGKPTTWSPGRNWLIGTQDWDWPSITFNEAREALYRQWLKLEPGEREKAMASASLTNADRKVFEHLARVPPAELDRATYDLSRRQIAFATGDVLALRKSAPQLASGSGVAEIIHHHNDNGVLAFRRSLEGHGDIVVAANFSPRVYDGYQVNLPPGVWQETLNSDSARYGGTNFGNFGAAVTGGSLVRLPANGAVVFRQVAPKSE